MAEMAAKTGSKERVRCLDMFAGCKGRPGDLRRMRGLCTPASLSLWNYLAASMAWIADR